MNRKRIAQELVAVAKTLVSAEMTPEELMSKLEAAYKSQFPKSFFSIRLDKGFKESITMRFGVQPKSDWENGIFHNDPAASIMIIYGVQDGQLGEILEVRDAMGGSLLVKPTDPHRAYGRVKFGWRKKKGTPEQILKHMTNYFRKMRQVVNATRDQHAHKIARELVAVARELTAYSAYEEEFLEQVGDRQWGIVEPDGRMWKPRGNVIYVYHKRDNPGASRYLSGLNFVERAESAGGSDPSVVKVWMKRV